MFYDEKESITPEWVFECIIASKFVQCLHRTVAITLEPLHRNHVTKWRHHWFDLPWKADAHIKKKQNTVEAHLWDRFDEYDEYI